MRYLILPDAYAIDDDVSKDNATALIPQAVAYSAGLLDHFFRGRLELRFERDDLVVEQASGSDPIGDGEVEVFCETKDKRAVLLEKQSWTRGEPATFKGLKSSLERDDLTVVAVFDGMIGSERGVAAGYTLDRRVWISMLLGDETVISVEDGVLAESDYPWPALVEPIDPSDVGAGSSFSWSKIELCPWPDSEDPIDLTTTVESGEVEIDLDDPDGEFVWNVSLASQRSTTRIRQPGPDDYYDPEEENPCESEPSSQGAALQFMVDVIVDPGEMVVVAWHTSGAAQADGLERGAMVMLSPGFMGTMVEEALSGELEVNYEELDKAYQKYKAELPGELPPGVDLGLDVVARTVRVFLSAGFSLAVDEEEKSSTDETLTWSVRVKAD